MAPGQQPYRDRREAGRRLGAALAAYRGRPGLCVAALPRGGVPVGYEVARALEAPLDVVVVRKLGVPFQPELAMGAIATGGILALNAQVVAEIGIGEAELRTVVTREAKELARREHAYRGSRAAVDMKGKTVVVVDDGLATGSSMRAAIASLRAQGAGAVVVAVPVGTKSTCAEIARFADEVVCPVQPEVFVAVGEWYVDFNQTGDDDVRKLLDQAARMRAPGAA